MAGTPPTADPPSGAGGRREAARHRTRRELQDAALDEVREHGAVGLSLRRVARRMGMSPAGLYRHVASREDLLTRLITDAYHDLADHLALALGGDPQERVAADRDEPRLPVVAGPEHDVADRLRAVAATYRGWAVAHPNEFGLLFGDPIPGYAAPADGPTVDAMTRVGAALGRPLLEAHRQGRLRTLEGDAPTDHLRARLEPMSKLDGQPIPPELALTLLLTWGRLHGQVSLEVFGHHRWLFPEGCQELFAIETEAMLDDLGLFAPEAPARSARR